MSDINFFSRAIKNRWGVTDFQRQMILQDCEKIIRDPEADPRYKAKARDTILKADELNLKEQAMYLPRININVDYASLTEKQLEAELVRLEAQEKSLQLIEDLNTICYLSDEMILHPEDYELDIRVEIEGTRNKRPAPIYLG